MVGLVAFPAPSAVQWNLHRKYLHAETHDRDKP
jgi:hypothetical protein